MFPICNPKLILLLCASLLACSLPAQWSKPEPLENGVILRLEAPVDENGRQNPSLLLTTKDPYECKDARFASETTITDSKVSIKITGVTSPADCEPKLQPVTLRVDLGGLATGEYPLRTTINRQFFKAYISISEDHFELRTDEDPNLFYIANGRLNKVPQGAIWGHMSYGEGDGKKMAEQFLAELEALGAKPMNLPPGDYGEFYIHFQGQPSETSTGPGTYDFPFVFEYEGGLEALKPLVEKYRQKIGLSLRSHSETL